MCCCTSINIDMYIVYLSTMPAAPTPAREPGGGCDACGRGGGVWDGGANTHQNHADGTLKGWRLDRWYVPAQCFHLVAETEKMPSSQYGFDHHLVTVRLEAAAEDAAQEKRPVTYLPEVLQS